MTVRVINKRKLSPEQINVALDAAGHATATRQWRDLMEKWFGTPRPGWVDVELSTAVEGVPVGSADVSP